jgi:molybdopterin molybdotransferase
MGEDLHGRPGLPSPRAGSCAPPTWDLLASLGIRPDHGADAGCAWRSSPPGDELRSLGDALDPGCIYDSNRYTLFGMLTRLGCELVDMGVVKDDPASLEAALRSACARMPTPSSPPAACRWARRTTPSRSWPSWAT